MLRVECGEGFGAIGICGKTCLARRVFRWFRVAGLWNGERTAFSLESRLQKALCRAVNASLSWRYFKANPP